MFRYNHLAGVFGSMLAVGSLAGPVTQAAEHSESSGIPHFVNFYECLAGVLGLQGSFGGEGIVAVLGAVLVLASCLIMGLYFSRYVEETLSTKDASPSGRPSLGLLIESSMDFVHSLAEEHCGKNYRRFLPLLGGLFVFILVGNLSGLLPGFPPPTENFSTNLAMGLVVFLCYNYAGLKEHGAAYIKQFTGPFLVLAPLFLGIEFVSHAVRPLSLAFRLLANIFCDHLLLGVFSGLIPLVIPSVFLFFGLLVAVIQSFVFTLLTGIYVNMAISHDH